LKLECITVNDEVKKNWQKIAEHGDEKTLDMPVDEAEQQKQDAEDVSDDSKEQVSSALEHPSYKALEEKLTQAEMKSHENWEKSVRAVAELDNFRRRAERDIANAHKYGVEKLIDGLLPVVDSLEQALQVADKSNAELTNMVEGIELTLKLFIDLLQKFGVTQINPEGELFNPQHHEAISMQEIPDVAANTVVNVFQKGYLLHERVIRPARVIVAKGTSNQSD
jgi:molecular chaperone GrpE